MRRPRRAGVAAGFLCCGTGMLGMAALLAVFVPPVAPPARAAQVRAVNMALRRAAGRVVFCVTKDTIIVAAVDDGTATALPAPGGAAPRLPAIVPLGAGRVAVVLGATDWTRDDAGKPTLLDEELPAMAGRVFSAAEKLAPLDQSATDIESLGVTVLEFVRPFVADIHYQLDLAPDEPLIEVLVAGYTEGYGPEIWDLHYRVQQRNLGSDYWDTRPLRPSYYQLYPPEKGQPRTFVEAQYPAKVAPLGLARAALSDPAVARIHSASPDIDETIAAILKGESNKAETRPTEDFLRLAIPAVAGAQAKFAVAAIDQQYRFQWVLAPEDAPAAPAETSAQPGTLRQQEQTERPSLRRAGPPPATQ
jgi:hypothetical protein